MLHLLEINHCECKSMNNKDMTHNNKDIFHSVKKCTNSHQV